MTTPERIRFAVTALDPRPGEWVLEIGGGRGASAELILAAVGEGRYVGVDRSAKATEAAALRNAAAVAEGRARFTTAHFDAYSSDERFDKILALNVNVFWTGAATAELKVAASLLRPDGRLVLCYDLPDANRTSLVTARLCAHLRRAGYLPEVRAHVPLVVDAVYQPG